MREIDFLPFLTFSEDNPDFDDSDTQSDLEEMMVRNGAIEQFLKGCISGDDLLGIVEASGMDADEYFSTVMDNMEYSMGKHYFPCESGLLLPI